MKLKNPNKTARKTPMIATVSAFLSEVCLSIHDTILLPGGGFAVMASKALSLSPQYTYLKSAGIARMLPSSIMRFKSNFIFFTSDFVNFADFGSIDTGNRI